MDGTRKKTIKKDDRVIFLNKDLTCQVFMGYAYVYIELSVYEHQSRHSSNTTTTYYWNDGVVILNKSAKYLLGDICHIQSTDDDAFQDYEFTKLSIIRHS